MKLFSRYSRINVLTTIVIFLLASAAYYYLLHFILINQIDEDLKIEEREIKGYIKEHHVLPESVSVQDQLIHYKQVNHPYTKRFFNTTGAVAFEGKKGSSLRQLFFGVNAGNSWYQVTVSKSLEETETLLQTILVVTSITILLILLTTFIINRIVLKRIWKPFYQTLSSARNFKVGSKEHLKVPETSIEEFQLMNQTLEHITRQAQLDYLALKTFSENASHEIQTPLAVIRSKLDLLIQDEGLTEQQGFALQRTYDAVQKLSKLNQSLLLLAKIENKQYEEVKAIYLKRKIEQKMMDFHELWQSNQIKIESFLQDSVVTINEELADLLLNNLLSNATKHNKTGGNISITLKDKELRISNTSNHPALQQEKLFQRFYKPEQNNESNGLGLSIIKQICEASGLCITYEFYEEHHVFTISW